MNDNNLGTLGVDPPIQDVIRRYFPGYPESHSGQLLADPEVALLAALLKQGEDVEPADFEMDAEDTTSNYYAETYTVTADGPRQNGQEPENVDGQKLDLGMVVDAFDLRFTDDIEVAFKGPNEDHRTITYRSHDSPVVGKEAITRYVWVRRGEQASSDPTLHLEGYEDGRK